MTIEEFLHQSETSVASVMSAIEEAVGLATGDVLLAAGSLLEGLGSRKSDLDLFLITDRKIELFEQNDEIIFPVGKCLIDIHILSRNRIKALIDRLKRWARKDYDTSESINFSHAERVLLHRLACGKVWFAEGEPSQEKSFRPCVKTLSRLKFHVARHGAKTIQVDMVGYLEEEHYQTLAFAAQKLLAHGIDALLAAYG